MKKKISVVINNYNYEHYLTECIQSVIDQTRQPDELIIVDDGSTDGSKKIITNYAKQYNFIKPIFQSNGGQTKAFNTGFSHAQGDIICFLDSDDKWYQDKLEKIEKKHEKYDIVQHYLEINGERIYRPIDCVVDWKKVLIEHGYLYANSPTSALSFDRDLLANYMPFDSPEKLRYCTDAAVLMLAMYFSKTGIGFIEEALGYYRVHGGNLFYNNTDNLLRGKDIQNKRIEYVTSFLKNHNFKLIPFENGNYIDFCIEQKIKSLEIYKNDKCYIWGTEFSGEAVSIALEIRNIDIEKYLDSDKGKQGNVFRGKPIINPDEILNSNPAVDEKIIIANSSQVVISEILDNSLWKNNYIKLPI